MAFWNVSAVFVGFVILIFCWKKIAYLDKHEMIE